MSEMPDFEPTVPPVVEYPKPKKPRRKPTRRKVARVVTTRMAARDEKRAKKRNVAKRRGRPAGSTNKPKAVPVEGYSSPVATILSVHAQIESSLSRLSLDERKAMLELFK